MFEIPKNETCIMLTNHRIITYYGSYLFWGVIFMPRLLRELLMVLMQKLGYVNALYMHSQDIVQSQ